MSRLMILGWYMIALFKSILIWYGFYPHFLWIRIFISLLLIFFLYIYSWCDFNWCFPMLNSLLMFKGVWVGYGIHRVFLMIVEGFSHCLNFLSILISTKLLLMCHFRMPQMLLLFLAKRVIKVYGHWLTPKRIWGGYKIILV